MSTALVAAQTADLLYDSGAFGHAMQLSEVLARSSLIPEPFRGKPADVLLALTIAQQQKQHPLLVMQSLYVISGKAGWSAQYIIAQANASGRLRGPIRWRYAGEGEDLSATAFATLAETGDEIEHTVSMAMARAEGWTKRNPKYQSMPKLMLSYRSATLLVRLFCPDVLMGLHTRDELVDIGEPEYIEPPAPTRKGRVETLRPAPRPAQARSLGVETEPAAGPSLAASTAPSHREAPTSTGAQAVEAASGPEELTDGQQLERAAYVETLLRMDESRRKRAVEAAGCAGIPRKALTLAQIRAIVQASIEPWEGPVPSGEGLLTQIADLTIDLEPYGAQLLLDCARAAGLPVADGQPVIDGAPEPALLRYLSALRGRAAELGVGR